MLIYPIDIAELTSERELKYFGRSRVRRILLRIHLDGDVARFAPTSQIETWTVVMVLGQCCVWKTSVTISTTLDTSSLTRAYAWISWRIPFNVSTGRNAVVKVIIRKDRSHVSVPGPAKSAFVFDMKRTVGFCDVAVMNVDAIFVGECGIGALPGSDTSTAASELNL